MHAQSIVELNRKTGLVCSGSDQHVAITTSITISIPSTLAIIGIASARTLNVCGSGRTLQCENTRVAVIEHGHRHPEGTGPAHHRSNGVSWDEVARAVRAARAPRAARSARAVEAAPDAFLGEYAQKCFCGSGQVLWIRTR